eukprot:c7882_g1_i1.p1 GENE.c7882_g1_i1~~c7882_g1_i1.p1  ORF type:complete len:1211 (-),score=406.53 c7882_g1_i1:72-3704(-)
MPLFLNSRTLSTRPSLKSCKRLNSNSAINSQRLSNNLSRYSQLMKQKKLAIKAIQSRDPSGLFQNLFPFLGQFVVLTAAVVPGVQAKETGKNVNEITFVELCQSLNRISESSDESNCFVSFGRAVSRFSSYNPIEFIRYVMGSSKFDALTHSLFDTAIALPPFTDVQLQSAQRCVLSKGLGSNDQQQTLSGFLATLTLDQLTPLQNLEQSVRHAVVEAVLTAGDQLDADMATVMRDVQQRQTGTELNADRIDPKAFVDLVPLVDQFLVYACAVVPTISSVHVSDQSSLLQSIALQIVPDMTSAPTFSTSTALNIITAVGEKQMRSCAYNPIAFAIALLGHDDSVVMLANVTRCAVDFHPLANDRSAREFADSLGQPTAAVKALLKSFTSSLSSDQHSRLITLRREVLQTITSRMSEPDGTPSTRFVKVIEAQLKEMTQTTPIAAPVVAVNPLEPSIVPPNRESLHQASIALMESEGSSPYRPFLPLLNQVLVTSTVVLPGLKASQSRVKRSTLATSAIIDSINTASGLSEGWSGVGNDLEGMQSALQRLGEVISRGHVFNAFDLMAKSIPQTAVNNVIALLLNASAGFSDFENDQQLQAAQQVAMSIGTGLVAQEKAILTFLESLPRAEQDRVTDFQKLLMTVVMAHLMTDSLAPSDTFVAQLSHSGGALASDELQFLTQSSATSLADGDSSVVSDAVTAPPSLPASLVDAVNSAKKATLEKGAAREAEIQSILLLQSIVPRSAKSIRFGELLPLLSQVFVTAGMVVPEILESREKRDFAQDAVTQTIFKLGGVAAAPVTDGHGDQYVAAIKALATVMGRSSGINPIDVLELVVGRIDMVSIAGDVTSLSKNVLEKTAHNVTLLNQVLAAVGTTFEQQEEAVQNYLELMAPEQRDHVHEDMSQLTSRILNAFTTASGEPSAALLEAVKETLASTTTADIDRVAGLQAKLVLRDSSSMFSNLITGVKDVVTVVAIAFPQVGTEAVQTQRNEMEHDHASTKQGTFPTSMGQLEASQVQHQMIGLGDVLNGYGYNPIQFVENVLGSEKMEAVVAQVVDFAKTVSALNGEQLKLADEVVNRFEQAGEHERIDALIRSLAPEQRSRLESVVTQLKEHIANACVSEDLEYPTPKLITAVQNALANSPFHSNSPFSSNEPAVVTDVTPVTPAPTPVPLNFTQTLLQTAGSSDFDSEEEVEETAVTSRRVKPSVFALA